jgi:hypothetical protein
MPGVYHMVEQRLRGDLPARSCYERGACLVLLSSCLREHEVSLCAYNTLPRRTLLVLIPARSGAIGRGIACADRMLAGLYGAAHHRFTPLWEDKYNCCPFADEVAWSVMRYVDQALARGNPRLVGNWAVNSAVEHASGISGFLTAPRDRLPSAEDWRSCLDSP